MSLSYPKMNFRNVLLGRNAGMQTDTHKISFLEAKIFLRKEYRSLFSHVFLVLQEKETEDSNNPIAYINIKLFC